MAACAFFRDAQIPGGQETADLGTGMGGHGRQAPFVLLAELWLHLMRQCALLSTGLENPVPDFPASLAARGSPVIQFLSIRLKQKAADGILGKISLFFHFPSPFLPPEMPA